MKKNNKIKKEPTIFWKHVIVELVELNTVDERIHVRIVVGYEYANGRHESQILVCYVTL